MITAQELRTGNFLVWNPKLTDAHTTLLPLTVEVAAITETEIGYNSPRIERRAEPFEDDELQRQTPRRPLNEFEPIPISAELLEKCGFVGSNGKLANGVHYRVLQNGAEWELVADGSPERKVGTVSSLHGLQNLFQQETGEELSVAF